MKVDFAHNIKKYQKRMDYPQKQKKKLIKRKQILWVLQPKYLQRI